MTESEEYIKNSILDYIRENKKLKLRIKELEQENKELKEKLK